jgi:A/G-specific adenine glycosylase
MPTAKKQTHRPIKSAKQFTLPSAVEVTAFRRKVLSYYAKQGRVLPFRQTTDPYAIAVSEFMLQQTQVSRVVPKYEMWLALFPDWKTLAIANRVSVLKAWSGLGYNRRAIYLHDLAKRVTNDFQGIFPRSEDELMGIPGLGPYTRRAILVFAFNLPLAAIDTNIRRVLLASFSLPPTISPVNLQLIAERVLPRRNSRIWHYALMDYGAMNLTAQKTGVRSLSRQSEFEGSLRQVRGAVIRLLSNGSQKTVNELVKESGFTLKRITQALAVLMEEGMIQKNRNRYSIAD